MAFNGPIYGARLYASAVQAGITQDTYTQVTLGNTDWNYGCTIVGNKIQVPVAGLYLCQGVIRWDTNATGSSYSAFLTKNGNTAGTSIAYMSTMTGTASTNAGQSPNPKCIVTLAASDQIGLLAYQNGSGGARATLVVEPASGAGNIGIASTYLEVVLLSVSS